MRTDPCLSCLLPDCDEENPGCLFLKSQEAISRRYYLKLKADPVRYAVYLRKKLIVNKRYQISQKGRATNNAQTKRWRGANLEAAKEISQRYHEKHKVERLAAAREYKRKRRELQRQEATFDGRPNTNTD